MSKAHEGKNIPTNTMSKTLPDGMYLFPLDGRVVDTTESIPLLMNTTTESTYNESKFLGSIAVEDATTNEFNMNSYKNNVSGWVHSTDGGKGQILIGEKDALGGKTPVFRKQGKLRIGNTVGTDIGTLYYGKTYTFSIYMRWVDGYAKQSGMSFDIVDRKTSIRVDGKPITSIIDHMTNEWRRFEVTAYHDNNTAYHFIDIGGYTDPGYFEYCLPQIEQKDHATSFVEGSRGVGNLKYNISQLGMRDAGCISFWVFNSDSMVNNKNTGNSTSNQYIIKLGSSSGTGWYDDTVTLQIPGGTTRSFRFWTDPGIGDSTSEDYLTSSTLATHLGQGTWNHFVIQWDKNGLPSGRTKELYINGKLEAGNNTTYLPQNNLYYLHLGQWNDDGSLMPSTRFEQVAIHPSKGFSEEEINAWYHQKAPFVDWRDKILFL